MPSLILSVLLLAASAPASSTSTLYDTVRMIERYSTAEEPRSVRLRTRYEAGIPATLRALDCASIDPIRLDDLFLATHLVAFYSPDTVLLNRMICLHGAMEASGIAAHLHHQKLYGVMVTLRQFELANRLRVRYRLRVPELPVLTPLAGEGPQVLVLVEDAGAKVVPWFSGNGWQVVAVVHPHCAPSRRAMDIVMKSSDFEWLRTHLKLLMPAGPSWLQQDMNDWNLQYPAHPIAAEMPGATLAGIHTDETPTFHLVKDGKVVEVIRGLPADPEPMERWRKRVLANR